MAEREGSMLQYWKKFDLQRLQRELSATATELANRQEASEQSRKRLIEQSREFKRSAPEDLKRLVAPLLKSFQAEIDSLLWRSKEAEAAFLGLYKRVADAPADPAVQLERLEETLERLQDVEAESQVLRDALEREADHQRQDEHSERKLRDSQVELSAKVADAERRVQDLHAAVERTRDEVAALKSKRLDRVAVNGNSAEQPDCAETDDSRQQEDAERMEEGRGTEELEEEEEEEEEEEGAMPEEPSCPGGQPAVPAPSTSRNLEMEVLKKEGEISWLMGEIRRLQAALVKLRETSTAQILQMEAQLQERNRRIQKLEEKLQGRTNCEIKSEINAMETDGLATSGITVSRVVSRPLDDLFRIQKVRAPVMASEPSHILDGDTRGSFGREENGSVGSRCPSELSSCVTPQPGHASGEAETPLYPQPAAALGLAAGLGLGLGLSPDLVPSLFPGSAQQLPISAGGGGGIGGSSVASSAVAAAAAVRSLGTFFPVQLLHSMYAAKAAQEASSGAPGGGGGTSGGGGGIGSSSAATVATSSLLYHQPGLYGPPSASPPAVLSPGVARPGSARSGSSPPPPPLPPPAVMSPGLLRNGVAAGQAECASGASSSSGGGGGSAGLAGELDEQDVDTTELARQVKEQLLKHNIGQRVFGHYVLGLSQGSVSEILARPKPWSKLTVKGKEPFLKMKQFLSDEQNVLALRAIQVKQRGSITPRIKTPESGSDEAIKSILEQAKKEIQAQKGWRDERGDKDKRPPRSRSGLSVEQNPTPSPVPEQGGSDETIRALLEQARREMEAQQAAMMRAEVVAGGDPASSSSSSAVAAAAATASSTLAMSSSSSSSSASSVSASSLADPFLHSPPQHQQQQAQLLAYGQQVIARGGGGSGGGGGGDSDALLVRVKREGRQTPSLQLQQLQQQQQSIVPTSQSHAEFVQSIIQRVKTELEDGRSQGGGGGGGGGVIPGITGGGKYRTSSSSSSSSSYFNSSASPLSVYRRDAYRFYPSAGPEPLVPPPPPHHHHHHHHHHHPHHPHHHHHHPHQQQPQQQQQSPQQQQRHRLKGPAAGEATQDSPQQQQQVVHAVAAAAAMAPAVVSSHSLGADASGGSEPPSPSPSAPPAGANAPSQSPLVVPGKPPRPCIAPLTPEQYEAYMYREVDTAELTRLVKEKLTKNGICQRIFGEKVLGLSQGSVSDMLSRPKPWGKLTQKGREPFIRMQLWLHNELGSSTNSQASPASQGDPSGDMDGCSPSPSPVPSPGESVRSLTDPVVPATEPVSAATDSATLPGRDGGGGGGHEEQHVGQPRGPSFGQSALSIQELVAISPELDTYAITKKVKEVLTDNNLGQRLFGESVLGLTQGSVSDLLARPKPWHKLSLKGREPFVRMQLWLNDPHSVERLRDMKRLEKKGKRSAADETSTRAAGWGFLCGTSLKRRSVGAMDVDGALVPPLSPAPSAGSPAPSLVGSIGGGGGGSSSGGGGCGGGGGGGGVVAKKPRVVLAPEEKEALKRAYEQEPYPSQQTIEVLAAQLRLRTSTVINWFHNYRSRIRRELFIEEIQQASPGHEPSSASGSTRDGPGEGEAPNPSRPQSSQGPESENESESSGGRCQSVLSFSIYASTTRGPIIKQEVSEEDGVAQQQQQQQQQQPPQQPPSLCFSVDRMAGASPVLPQLFQPQQQQQLQVGDEAKGQSVERSSTFFSELLMARANNAALLMHSPEIASAKAAVPFGNPVSSSSSSPSSASSPKPEVGELAAKEAAGGSRSLSPPLPPLPPQSSTPGATGDRAGTPGAAPKAGPSGSGSSQGLALSPPLSVAVQGSSPTAQTPEIVIGKPRKEGRRLRRDEVKAANLNSIINRLEKAASKEDSPDWEF
ncbi:homeobox protein cut-like 1 isoform X1 [Lampetra planeri]